MKHLRSRLLAFVLITCSPFAVLAGVVNINTADAETLRAELKGVGKSRAVAIVTYRKQNGPFKTIESLAEVDGIGKRTIESNRKNIKLK